MQLYYDVAFDNTPLVMPVSLNIVKGRLNIVVGDVPEVGLSLTPAGGGMEAIMSVILDPIAELLVDKNVGSLNDMFGGQTYELVRLDNYTFGTMSVAVESIATAAHSVEGKPVLKLLPVLSIGPRKAVSVKVASHEY